MQESKDMTMPAIAIRLGVSVATIRRWIDTHGLPAMRVGRAIRIPAYEFEEWYANHILRLQRPRFPFSDKLQPVVETASPTEHFDNFPEALDDDDDNRAIPSA